MVLSFSSNISQNVIQGGLAAWREIPREIPFSRHLQASPPAPSSQDRYGFASLLCGHQFSCSGIGLSSCLSWTYVTFLRHCRKSWLSLFSLPFPLYLLTDTWQLFLHLLSHSSSSLITYPHSSDFIYCLSFYQSLPWPQRMHRIAWVLRRCGALEGVECNLSGMLFSGAKVTPVWALGVKLGGEGQW